MTRRKLLGTFLGTAAAAVPYPCLVEPRWLEQTNRKARISRVRPAGPVRILHLADLHASLFVPMSTIAHAVTEGIAERPDLICLTGDFITRGGGFDFREYVQALRPLSRAAPTYAVLGNHDGGPWAAKHFGFADHRMVERLLEESGIQLLHNRAVRVETAHQTVTLVGVGDLWTREVDARRAWAGVDPRYPSVLLAHNPDTKDVLRRAPWDLMLSGHTHGGQVRIPFEGAPFAPVKDKRYVSGLKPWGSRLVYVTRGVGNLGSVRLGCRPEVSMLTLS